AAGAGEERRARLFAGGSASRRDPHGHRLIATIGLPFSPVRRNGPRGPIFFRERQNSLATTYEKERTLQSEIAPKVERDVPGAEVLAIELLTPSRFCVYVDHPEGVDHALCARVTDALRDYLREYTIDVSSPGTERPLRKQQHFAAALGRKVSLRTREPIDGRSKL